MSMVLHRSLVPTSIQVSHKLKKRLQRHKSSPRETYEAVIEKALDLLEEDDRPVGSGFKREIAAGRRDIAKGKLLTTEELLAELGL